MYLDMEWCLNIIIIIYNILHFMVFGHITLFLGSMRLDFFLYDSDIVKKWIFCKHELTRQMRRLVKLGFSSKLLWRLWRMRMLTRLPAGINIKLSSSLTPLTKESKNTDGWHRDSFQPEGNWHNQAWKRV